MIKPTFYFEVASTNPDTWQVERDAYAEYTNSGFEILMEYPYTHNELSKEKQDLLKSLVDTKRLSFHGATLNLTLLALNEQIVEETSKILCNQLEVASWFGCEQFTFHVGEYPYFIENEKDLLHLELKKNLSKLITKSKELGCQLCIENLKNKHTYPRTIQELDAVFEECPELGLALDIRHACVVGEDPVEMAQRYGSRLKAVHYRPDCGISSNQLKRLFEVFSDINFSGTFIIEDPSLNVIDKSQRPMIAEAVKQLKPYLKF